ncbi:TonB-dependent receptor [Zhongshania sp.]|uniref:TonB-dependent receptor n=1 Tax=Zhongshania sp. TaxID=1971902 RepID=UPI003566461A
MNRKKGVVLPLTLAVLGTTPVQQVIAQGRGQIEEVVVTANKREQNLQDVPMAISAFSGDQLENYQIGNIEDLTKLVPSLKYIETDQPSHASLNIRGVGSFVSGPAMEAGVSVVVDEVPVARTEMASFEYSDVERIEVLRGPQGTLFGKNSTAGLVHVISRDPADQFEARINALYEDPGELPGYNSKVDFSASGPVSDNVGVRFSGFVRQEEGPYEDVSFEEIVPKNDSYGGRLKVVWDATETLTAKLTIDHQNFDGEASPVTFASMNEESASKSRVDFHEENNKAETFGTNESILINSGLGLIINWERGDHLFTSVTGYRDFENSYRLGIPNLTGDRLDVNNSDGVRNISSFTQEFRITSMGGGAIDYTAGVLWFDNDVEDYLYGVVTDIPAELVVAGTAPGFIPLPDLEFLGFVPGESFNQQATQDSDVGTENLGVYGQLTWHISEAWQLTGGSRYINEEVTVASHLVGSVTQDGTGVPLSETDLTVAPTSVIDEAVIGTVSLSHDWSDDIKVYATVSTGYRGRAFDLYATDLQESIDNPIEPETSFNTEAGIKTRLFDNSLQLNAAIFKTVFKNFQSQISELVVEGGVPTYKNRVESAGELQTAGLEVDIQAKPLESVTVFGSLLYNPTQFNEYTTSCFPGQQPGERGGEDLNDDGKCDQQDVAGEPLGKAPEKSVSLVARYDTPFFNGNGFAQLGGRWQSETKPSNRNPFGVVDSYTVLDLNLGWRGLDNRFEAVFYVKNLLDEFWVIAKSQLSPAGYRDDIAHFISRDADRTFGISFGYEW